MTKSKQPFVVAFAEKFAWEVFLTDKWNHLFASNDRIFPRDTSFFVTSKVWGPRQQFEGDERIVRFEENSTGSKVTVGMRLGKGNFEFPDAWYPNSISMHVLITNKDDAERHGSKYLTIPPTKVMGLIEMARKEAKEMLLEAIKAGATS